MDVRIRHRDEMPSVQGQGSLADLPLENLVEIFSYLPLADRFHAALVCKKFLDVFACPALWCSFSFAFCSSNYMFMKPTAERTIVHVLTKHKRDLKCINIHADTSVYAARKVCSFLSKLDSMKNLKEFKLFSSPVDSNAPYKARNFCSRISGLIETTTRLSVCGFDSTPVCDQTLESLAKCSSTSLQQLQIRQCYNISKSGVLNVARNCTNLRAIALHYSCLSSDILLALTHRNHVPMMHIRIDVLKGEDISHEIDREAWGRLMERSSGLKLVMNFHCLSDNDFNVFFNCQTPVTHLIISQSFSKSFLFRVSHNCPLLVDLCICGICSEPVDKEVKEIAMNCHQMKSIKLSGFFLSCETLEVVARKCGSNLDDLVVEDSFIEGDYDEQERMCRRVSNFMGQSWSPLLCPFFS